LSLTAGMIKKNRKKERGCELTAIQGLFPCQSDITRPLTPV
jgi:hypothetical protein